MISGHELLLEELGISPQIISDRNLQYFPEAVTLEVAEVGADGGEHFLIPEAAKAWRRMKEAARSDREEIFIVSAYRSISRQVEIIRGKLEKGLNLSEILKVCAPPGCSEHHTGCAMDVSTPDTENLSEEFENTSAFQWLKNNAVDYSFYLSYPRNNAYGYDYEPWHWRYDAT